VRSTTHRLGKTIESSLTRFNTTLIDDIGLLIPQTASLSLRYKSALRGRPISFKHSSHISKLWWVSIQLITELLNDNKN
jgi:hypothetical protein